MRAIVHAAPNPIALGRARYRYCAFVLGALAMLQIAAFSLQFRSGFRPLSHPPTRVPYSWDMFAIRIERCILTWDPPLQINGQKVARWHDRMPPLEFDHVYDDDRSYADAAQVACMFRTHPNTVTSLTCFTADGKVDERRIPCR
jgi:hypothetical protein